jgi:hypothetical protein
MVPDLMHGISEKRSRSSIFRESGPCSHAWDWWEETMVLYRQIEWSLFSCMWLVRRDHDVVYLSIQHRGLFSPIPYMRTGATLSVYKTPWSLLTNSIHETMDHSICLYNIMISSNQSHIWDQGPITVLYRQIEWSLFSCMGLVRRDHGVV